MLIELFADLGEDVVRHLCHQVHTCLDQEHEHQVQSDADTAEYDQPARVGVCDIYVYRPLDDERIYDRYRGRCRHYQENNGDQATVIEQVREQADQRFPLGNRAHLLVLLSGVSGHISSLPFASLQALAVSPSAKSACLSLRFAQ